MPEGGTVFLKCAVDEVKGHSSATAVQANKDLNGKVTTSSLHCGASCVPPKGSQRPKGTEDGQNSTDALLGMAGESGASAIDYNRYCFYNCRPYDFNVGNICTNLRKDTKSVIKDEVDHGLHPLVTDPKVQGAWGVSTGALPAPMEAPSTTTAQLPCAQSDPCAYGLMKQSIIEAKNYYGQTATKAFQTAGIARTAGGMIINTNGMRHLKGL